jgi:hypothetical protein
MTATPTDLRRLGETAFGGESIYPPGIHGIPITELDSYALAFHSAAGRAAFEPAANRQFLTELGAAAELGGDWGHVGALCVGWNSVAEDYLQELPYLRVVDQALEVMRTDGVAYSAVPPFAMKQWTAVHGYGEIEPKGWPSPLAKVPIVSAEEAPPVENLAEGEVRKLAQAPAAPQNMVCAERRGDGSIQAVMEGTNPDTGELRRWDWDSLRAPDYPSFLRQLGDRLVTHTYWAHDDLVPYFPCRQRSRDQLRIEARAQLL